MSPLCHRRAFLQSAGAAATAALAAGSAAYASPDIAPSPEGLVLGASQGEHLIHFRDHGDVWIKVSAVNGSRQFALGTQQITRGAGIPVHRHLHMEESFYVLQGSGVVLLDDEPHPFEAGATLFIPPKTWHGFDNREHEVVLLWLTAPAGLDGFFRETCSPPGVPPKSLTREQIRDIARKYGTEFRA